MPIETPSTADKSAAARLARSIADEFNATADTPELARTLPILAVKFMAAGENVTPDILRDHARQGVPHIRELLNGLSPANANPVLTYEQIVMSLRRKLPLEKLFAMKAPTEAAVADCDLDDHALLKTAAERGHLPMLKYLHAQGVDLAESDNQAVGYAAENGHLPAVKFLLAHGADAKTEDNFALVHAAENGHLHVVKFLHAMGVSLTAGDHQALGLAAQNGHLPVVKYLHKHGVNLIGENNRAMRFAIGNGHLPVVKYLHRHGVSLSEGIAQAHDCLYEAARNGHLPMVKYLHEHDIYWEFIKEWALKHAALNSHLPIVKYLHENGVVLSGYEKLRVFNAMGEDHFAVLEYMAEQGENIAGISRTNIGHRFTQWQKAAEIWRKGLRMEPPSGLLSHRPDGFHPVNFEKAREWFRNEYYSGATGNNYAYQLSVLFGTEDRILRYLQKWGKPVKQPLHDLTYFIEVPQEGPFDAKTWGDAVLRHGPAMARLVKFADRLPQPLATLKATRAAVAQFAYKRGGENSELAALCVDHAVNEKDFNRALNLYLEQKKLDFPKKNIPDFRVDGGQFDMAGAVFRRLPPDDVRGLFLGELTDCCQSIGGAGAACAEHGFTSPDGGFYVVETKEGEIIGQCWAWRGTKDELCLDSLETLGDRVTKRQWGVILEQIKTQLAQPENKKYRVSSLMIGAGGDTPTGLPFEKSPDPAAPKNYSGHRDSRMQYRVCGKCGPKPTPSAPAP